jgi:hypothetical protein
MGLLVQYDENEFCVVSEAIHRMFPMAKYDSFRRTVSVPTANVFFETMAE